MRAFIVVILLGVAGIAAADEKQDRMSREELLTADNMLLQAQLLLERRAAIFARHGVQLAADGTPIGVDADGVIHRAPPKAAKK